MIPLPDLPAAFRTMLLAGIVVPLSACTSWTAHAAPPRNSVALAEPGSMGRPEWLQHLVAAMDAQAFPDPEALRLKLSWELSTAPSPLARNGAYPAGG